MTDKTNQFMIQHEETLSDIIADEEEVDFGTIRMLVDDYISEMNMFLTSAGIEPVSYDHNEITQSLLNEWRNN